MKILLGLGTFYSSLLFGAWNYSKPNATNSMSKKQFNSQRAGSLKSGSRGYYGSGGIHSGK